MYWKLKLYQLTWGAPPSEHLPEGKQCQLPSVLAKIATWAQVLTSAQMDAVRLMFL